MTEWNQMDRTPKAYKRIVLRCAIDGLEYYGLTYCSHRGAIIDPITGQTALPIIGPCDGWRYDERDAA